MKLKLTVLISFVFMISTSVVIGQQKSTSKSGTKISINWGTKYKNEKDEAIQDILYDDGENIYATVVTTKTSKIAVIGSNFKSKVTPSLVKFDSKMMPVKRKDYTTSEKDLYYHGTYFLGGRFILITSKLNTKTNSRELFAQKLSTSLEPEGASELIWKIVGQKGYDVDFGFNFSEDSTKFAIGIYPEQKKTENKVFGVKVFDKDLKDIYEKKISLKVPSEQVVIKNLQVNNKNEIFVLAKVYDDAKKKEEVRSDNGKVPGFKYVLMKYGSDESEKKFDLEMKNKFLRDFYMKTAKNGDLELFLSYEQSYDDGINGFMYLKLESATGNPSITTDYPVTAALAQRIDDIQDDKPKNKLPAIHNYFSITDLHTVEDGSTFAIIEKNYNVSDKYGMTYYSQGMIVMKLDPAGSVKWCDYIPKAQFYNGFSGLIYHTVMYYDNKLFLFYNDEKENEHYDITNSKKEPKKFNDLKEVYFMLVEFDENGKMKRNTISNTKAMETNIDISLSKQLSSGRMVLCGTMFNHFGGNRQTKLGVADFE